MMRAIMICVALLAGCAGNSTIPLGGETAGPAGWAIYCSEHPERTECR